MDQLCAKQRKFRVLVLSESKFYSTTSCNNRNVLRLGFSKNLTYNPTHVQALCTKAISIDSKIAMFLEPTIIFSDNLIIINKKGDMKNSYRLLIVRALKGNYHQRLICISFVVPFGNVTTAFLSQLPSP